MAGNIATLVPITKNDPLGRGGRKPGQVNLTTKVLKRAILLAGAQSEHSKPDQTLLSYVTWLANARPELYVSLLLRLVPQEAKIKVEDNPQYERLTSDMPLEAMVKNFEAQIKSDYQPSMRTIEHDDDDEIA